MHDMHSTTLFLQIPCQHCKQCNAADFNPFTAELSDAFPNALEKTSYQITHMI